MSIVHVNQIRNHVTKLFERRIDLSDVADVGENRENRFLTRALAAYSLHHLAEATVELAAAAVTDQGEDNGIDAIYFDERERRLYLVQSKWIHSGSGEPDNGSVKKFTAGVRDLLNLRFERFNPKIRGKKDLVINALQDPHTKCEMVVVYTGINSLAEPSRRDLDDIALEMNDASEVLTVTPLNQPALHNSLTVKISGEPINLDVGLSSWGRLQEPHLAYYGQVGAEQIGDWWRNYRSRLFTRNLRSILGDTDVNKEIRDTLEKRPQDFWYCNNGVTMIAKKVTKTMVGGGETSFGTFHCEDISIVNGAQTVGSIGKFGETNGGNLARASLPIRIISLSDSDASFGELVTKTNNRQNRIENRDFVTLDPEQSRLKTELAIDGIDYHVMRAESVAKSPTSFDLVDSTTALACASGKVQLVVQLKREIGRLWDDIAKAPYKELFNGSVSGLFVWRCVRIQRMIDSVLIDHLIESGILGRRLGVLVHGNRMVAAFVFKELPTSKFGDPSFDPVDQPGFPKLKDLAIEKLGILADAVDAEFPNAIIPTLFKNLTKCRRLDEVCSSPKQPE